MVEGPDAADETCNIDDGSSNSVHTQKIRQSTQKSRSILQPDASDVISRNQELLSKLALLKERQRAILTRKKV